MSLVNVRDAAGGDLWRCMTDGCHYHALTEEDANEHSLKCEDERHKGPRRLELDGLRHDLEAAIGKARAEGHEEGLRHAGRIVRQMAALAQPTSQPMLDRTAETIEAVADGGWQ